MKCLLSTYKNLSLLPQKPFESKNARRGCHPLTGDVAARLAWWERSRPMKNPPQENKAKEHPKVTCLLHKCIYNFSFPFFRGWSAILIAFFSSIPLLKRNLLPNSFRLEEGEERREGRRREIRRRCSSLRL